MCLEQNRKVLVSERGGKLFISVGGHVCPFVDCLSNWYSLIPVGIHLAEALCGLCFGLLFVGPKLMQKDIVFLKSFLEKDKL